MRRCTKCGATKPLAEFSVLRESKREPGTMLYRPRCKACEVEAQQERYGRDPEGHRAAAKRYRDEMTPEQRARSMERTRRSSWKRRYGITPEEYAKLLDQQNGVCAACHRPEVAVHNGEVRRLAVDHDHLTGQVRGLLCTHCNIALGQVSDSAEHLKMLIYYLEGGV